MSQSVLRGASTDKASYIYLLGYYSYWSFHSSVALIIRTTEHLSHEHSLTVSSCLVSPIWYLKWEVDKRFLESNACCWVVSLRGQGAYKSVTLSEAKEAVNGYDISPEKVKFSTKTTDDLCFFLQSLLLVAIFMLLAIPVQQSDHDCCAALLLKRNKDQVEAPSSAMSDTTPFVSRFSSLHRTVRLHNEPSREIANHLLCWRF